MAWSIPASDNYSLMLSHCGFSAHHMWGRAYRVQMDRPAEGVAITRTLCFRPRKGREQCNPSLTALQHADEECMVRQSGVTAQPQFERTEQKRGAKIVASLTRSFRKKRCAALVSAQS